jgi:hypothetical protein
MLGEYVMLCEGLPDLEVVWDNVCVRDAVTDSDRVDDCVADELKVEVAEDESDVDDVTAT